MFKYFLNTRPYLIYIAIELAFAYLFMMIFFLFEKKYGLYMSLLLIVIAFLSFLYVFRNFKKDYLILISEIKEIKFNEYINDIKTKFSGEKDFFILLEKIDFAKNLVKTRFNNSIFEERLNILIEDSLGRFIKNMEIISDMNKAKKLNEESLSGIDNVKELLKKRFSVLSESSPYDKELLEIKSSNSKIIENIELLIKEMLVERKEENNSEDINLRFKESFSLYEKLKGVSK